MIDIPRFINAARLGARRWFNPPGLHYGLT
jgi:hypothetical protein